PEGRRASPGDRRVEQKNREDGCHRESDYQARRTGSAGHGEILGETARLKPVQNTTITNWCSGPSSKCGSGSCIGVTGKDPSGSAETVMGCGLLPTPETTAAWPMIPLNLIWNASPTRRTWTTDPAQSNRALKRRALLE